MDVPEVQPECCERGRMTAAARRGDIGAGGEPVVGARAEIRWALSPSGWVNHAVDESRYPRGVRITECGLRLIDGGILLDSPAGVLCQDCVELQVARALAASHPAPDG